MSATLKPGDLAMIRLVLPWVGRTAEPLNRPALIHLVEVVAFETGDDGVEQVLVRAVSNGAEVWVQAANLSPIGERAKPTRKPQQSTIQDVAAEARRRGGKQW